MTLPTSASTLSMIVTGVQGYATNVKAQAQNALLALQTTTVNAVFIFQMLDELGGIIAQLNAWKATSGLDAYATANIPGYAGSLVADITAVVNASQNVINWIATNFPADTGGYLQAFKLNADGSRAPATFTPTQTAGLQTQLTAFIQTIG